MKTSSFLCFSSELKTALEEIVSGKHNDSRCNKFQEYHENRYGVAPAQCKYKENPQEIHKLIEKIDINKALTSIRVSKLKTAAIEQTENIVKDKSTLDEETFNNC